METLADIPDSQVIHAVCDPCGRMVPLNRFRLDQALTLDEVRQRLRCTRCGRRSMDLRRVPTYSQRMR